MLAETPGVRLLKATMTAYLRVIVGREDTARSAKV